MEKKLRTKDQYIEHQRKLKRNIYCNGELIDRDDEMQQGAINVIGLTFEEAAKPENEDLCTAVSHISGNRINRFTHIHQSNEDLHRKQDMTRMLCRKAGFCIGRCMGIDGTNAVNAVSFEADKMNEGKTEYHKNFLKWLQYFQDNDLVGCCAQTDVKGQRKLRPGQQPDPDTYLRIVERKSDGIVVRGCKVHISESSNADEIIALPNRALLPEESDYAVAFAVPADHEGVNLVMHPHNNRKREVYQRGFKGGYTDCYVIFDDVFVPWERVFLAGEPPHGGMAALLFALFHRHSYSGCKPALGDVLLGLAAMAAEINGIEKTSHVRAHLAEIIKISELGYAAGFTASAMGSPQAYLPGMGLVPYGPGSYIPHSIYANVGRCLTGEAVFHEKEILCDIAGGIPATFPYEKDFENKEIGKLLKKYTMRNPNIPIEKQIQFWYLFIDYTTGAGGGSMDYGNYHGGGSPIMEQIAITSQYDIEDRKNLVKELAGTKPK